MTLIDLLTIVACLIAGAFTIRLGNNTLRKQRLEKKRRQHKGMDVEGAGQEAESALRDLELWRKQGYLKATDASWEQLLKIAKKHPEPALELRNIVVHNIEQIQGQPRKEKSVLSVTIKLADEDSAELSRDLEKARATKPKDTLMVQAPLLAHR